MEFAQFTHNLLGTGQVTCTKVLVQTRHVLVKAYAYHLGAEAKLTYNGGCNTYVSRTAHLHRWVPTYTRIQDHKLAVFAGVAGCVAVETLVQRPVCISSGSTQHSRTKKRRFSRSVIHTCMSLLQAGGLQPCTHSFTCCNAEFWLRCRYNLHMTLLQSLLKPEQLR